MTSTFVVPAKAGTQRLMPAAPKKPCVYILANHRNGTIYVGVTSNLLQRVWQHKSDFILGFTQSHQVHALVWFEQHVTMQTALAREKAIKKWNRAWKIDLVEKSNPYWRDLYSELI